MTPDSDDEDLRVPGEAMLELPGFWAAHLLWLAEGEDYEPDSGVFGVDAADLNAAYERLTDPAAWPVIRVPLQHGHHISIVYRDFVEDEGIDYYLSHPDWARSAPLASLEGHFSGPGLAWRELVFIADDPADGNGVHERNRRLLLLLPILGDSALPDDAALTVSTALAAIGAPAPTRMTLAQALLDHPFWGGESWYVDGPDRVLLCRGGHSPRAVPFRLSAEHGALLAETLGGAA